MKKKSQKTAVETREDAKRNWVHVDVTDQVVGRAASKIAEILRGKNRATYTPNVDCGDFVVVTNASKVRFTGNKMADKMYYHHTGFFGGMKSISAAKQLEKHPDRILLEAVWGMLPRNTLSRQLIKKLKIYSGTEHPHKAQLAATVKI